MFQLLKRNDNLEGSDKPFISLSYDHVRFNSVFCLLAGVKLGMRVTMYSEESTRSLGFRFHHEFECNSFSLSKQGRSASNQSYWSAPGEIKNLPWAYAICEFDSKQRRFEPKLEKTEIGSIWIIRLCPSFENKKARESELIPSDVSGIYRYKRDGEVVYIGRGQIRKRLYERQRQDWDFDLIEYTIVEDPDEQAKWEYYWIEKYKSDNGRLPIYNKLSGCAA